MKKLIATGIGLTTSLLAVSTAFAQETVVNPCPPSSTFFKLCSSFGADSIGRIVGTALTILLVAAVIIALFFLVYGGIRWITSGGDKAKVESARSHVIAAIVGLIIAFVAYFIVQIILSIFGLGDVSQLKLPSFAI